MVAAQQQTLKELAAPNVENQPLCINIDNNINFMLKSAFIHLLPIFNGLAGENPLYSSQGVPYNLHWHEITWR
jgi:hypothetical protein